MKYKKKCYFSLKMLNKILKHYTTHICICSYKSYSKEVQNGTNIDNYINTLLRMFTLKQFITTVLTS